MRIVRLLVGVAAVAAVLGLGASAQETLAPPAQAQAVPRVAAGPAPDLTLVVTGQVVGYVEPCG